MLFFSKHTKRNAVTLRSLVIYGYVLSVFVAGAFTTAAVFWLVAVTVVGGTASAPRNILH